jgi:hypothetical protein
MSGDGTDDTKRPRRTFRAPLGRGGVLKIYVGPASEQGASAAVRPPAAPSALFPVDAPDDELIPAPRPFVYFHDLATDLHPEGLAEYVERKGLLPVEPGGTYRDEDWKAYEAEMLGRLLHPNDDSLQDPTGSAAVASSASGRKAPRAWVWNKDAFAGQIPGSFQLLLKPGLTAPPGGYAFRDSHWKDKDIEGETWAPSNLDHDLAPDYGYWKVPGHTRYGGVSLFDARYQSFDTGASNIKVTREPDAAADRVDFLLKWPLHVYAVPRVFRPTEVAGASLYCYGERRLYEIIERGTEIYWDGTPRDYYVQRLTTWLVTVPPLGFGPSTSFLIEESLYPAARPPLFPRPWAFGGETATAEYFVAHHLPPASVQTRRRMHLLLQRRVTTIYARVSPGWYAYNYGLDPGTLTERSVDETLTFPRRPLQSGLADEARARVEQEVAADMGIPVSELNTSHALPDDGFTISAAPVTVSPSYQAPAFDPFSVPPRAGQLCAVLVSGGKKFYVWRA